MNEQSEPTTSLRRLLDGTLVCPACHSSLQLVEEGLQCVGEEARPTDTMH
jgi:uncharacterized protein YbaR (Trm112 family)